MPVLQDTERQRWLRPPQAPAQAGFRIAAHPGGRPQPQGLQQQQAARLLPVQQAGAYLQRPPPAHLGPPRVLNLAPPLPQQQGAAAGMPGAYLGVPQQYLDPRAPGAPLNAQHPALTNFHLANASAHGVQQACYPASAAPLPRMDSGGSSLGSIDVGGLSKADLLLLAPALAGLPVAGGAAAAPDQAHAVEMARLRSTLGKLSVDTGVPINSRTTRVRRPPRPCYAVHDPAAAVTRAIFDGRCCAPAHAALPAVTTACLRRSAPRNRTLRRACWRGFKASTHTWAWTSVRRRARAPTWGGGRLTCCSEA